MKLKLATKKKPALFEIKRRGEGWPPICNVTNLLAFKTEQAMHDWHQRRGGHGNCEPFKCTHCQHWHYQWTAASRH